MIYLIEELWVDSLENRGAYGYKPVGYVKTEVEALAMEDQLIEVDFNQWPYSYILEYIDGMVRHGKVKKYKVTQLPEAVAT